MWKRRPVIPGPHLFAGLIKRTSFTFDEYFRSTLVPASFSAFRCLVILPTPIPPSPSYRSTLSNSPPILDLYPRQSRYSLETLSFNFVENSCLLYPNSLLQLFFVFVTFTIFLPLSFFKHNYSSSSLHVKARFVEHIVFLHD